MKTRNGFVSNSSSTSFCIYGIYIDDCESYDCKDLGELENLFIDVDIEVHYGYEGGDMYIGKSWAHIKDDQTGKEFKTEIETIIKENLPTYSDGFDTYEECWRDG